MKLQRLTLTSWHSPGADHSWMHEVLSTVESGAIQSVTLKFGFAVYGDPTELVRSLLDELRVSGLLKHIDRVLSEARSFVNLPLGAVHLTIDPTYYDPSDHRNSVYMGLDDYMCAQWDRLVRGEMAQSNVWGILRSVVLTSNPLDILTSSTNVLREA